MNLDRDVCERKYLEWLSGGRKEKKFAFIHERLFFKVFTPFVNSLILSISQSNAMLFCQTNAVLSNKCQMPTYNSYTYTHSHSRTFFYFDSKFPFQFDLCLIQFTIFINFPIKHTDSEFQSSLSLTKPRLFWCKTQLSKP